MAGYLTVDQLRARVETAVDDDALGRLIAAQEIILDRHAGPLTIGDYETPDPVAEIHDRVTTSMIPLKMLPADIDTVTLHQGTWDPAGTAFLEDDDWRLLYGNVLTRNDRVPWGGRVVVVYTPANDLEVRREAVIKLCELELNWQPGLGSESAQGWQEGYADPDAARLSILLSVHEPELFA